jgi:hypothetical protein
LCAHGIGLRFRSFKLLRWIDRGNRAGLLLRGLDKPHRIALRVNFPNIPGFVACLRH